MAEFTAGHTSTQAVVADTDLVILQRVGKVIITLGHGTDEDADALFGIQRLNVVSGPHNGSLETESHLAAVGRQVVRNGVFDNLQQLLLRIRRADGQPVKELNHQTGKPLECPRNAHGGIHFDQDALGGMDEDLQLSGLVDRGIEEGQETL